MKIRGAGARGGPTGTDPVRPAPAQPPVRTAATAQGPRRIGDATSVLGLSEAELSPGVRAALEQLLAEVDRLRQELELSRRRIAHLERLADEDSLVPLANRRAFVRELSRVIAYAERYGVPGSLLYFDVNEMKAINDAHGHAAGDAALRRVADILSANVRGSDVVGRLGGDEFGVILAQADRAAAESKAGALAALIAGEPLRWQEREIALSVSYGVHCFEGVQRPDEAIAAADRAMYGRKQQKPDPPDGR